MTQVEPMDLSLVIPIFNEGENILELYVALKKVLQGMGLSYEIIFVDDGSRDESGKAIVEIHRTDVRVKLISLSRNFGHQTALSAGLDYAGGNAVVMMDGDMQHPPEVVRELVRLWKEGYDIVNTIRKDTMGAGWFKKWSSELFYRLIGLMTQTPIPPGAADFRLLDRAVVDELKKFPERSRFYRGLVSWMGFRQTAVSFTAPPRKHGMTGYSLRRMIRFAMDGMASFSSFPLRIATYMGFLVSGVSFIYGVYTVLIGLFSERSVPGWASLMVVVLFLGGVQLVTLGILGEYVGRVYEEVKGRPLYLVQRVVGEFKRTNL